MARRRNLHLLDDEDRLLLVGSQKLGQGTVLQGRYDPVAKTRTEGYGPTQVPYELVA